MPKALSMYYFLKLTKMVQLILFVIGQILQMKMLNLLETIARFYALGIHAVNSGLLEADIIETLKNHDTSNPYNSLFVHNVLIEIINIEKTIKKRIKIYRINLLYLL